MTEFELTGLKPDTNYIVTIKLLNEVGVAEQKFRIKTNAESIGEENTNAYKRFSNDCRLFFRL